MDDEARNLRDDFLNFELFCLIVAGVGEHSVEIPCIC